MEKSPTHFRKGMANEIETAHRAGATKSAAFDAVHLYHPERQRFRGFFDYQSETPQVHRIGLGRKLACATH